MIVSDFAPMMGSRMPNSGYKTPSRRGYAKPRPWVRFERDHQRRFEQDLFALELADEFSPEDEFAPGPVTFRPAYPDEQILSDDEVDFLLGCPDGDQCDYEGCGTGRRNLAAQREEAEVARLARLARYSLDDDDLPGWGTEIQWSDLHHFTNA